MQLSHSVWIVSPQSPTQGLRGRSGAPTDPRPHQAESACCPPAERDVATWWLHVGTDTLSEPELVVVAIAIGAHSAESGGFDYK